MKGWTNADVARDLAVHPDTVARYRDEYEKRIDTIAKNNPGMLLEVIQNTVRAIEELDIVRMTAWREYEAKEHVECEACGNEVPVAKVGPQTRNTFLKTVLAAQEQRHKLFGLFGVKQEFFMQVQQIRELQNKLLDFMQRELCAADREKLAAYLQGVDTSQFQDVPQIPEHAMEV